MPSRDQVVRNGPRLVWLGSLGLGVADRQAGTRVEELQVRRVDSELDLMAEIAGMRLRERWADWDRSPFTSDSPKHISVWERP